MTVTTRVVHVSAATAGDDLGPMLRQEPLSALHCERVGTVALALRRVDAGGVDAVLLELDRLDGDPHEIAEMLAAWTARVPVVAVTGVAAEAAAYEAVRVGAQDGLIREQVTPQLLARVLVCALERHRQLTALRALSITDALTGLHNRRGFEALAEAQLRMSRRTGRPALVVCADLDDLKVANDRYGHAEGDRLITLAADVLRATFRGSDVVARIGGDEFVAFAYDVEAGAETVLAGRIAQAVAAANAQGRTRAPLALSLGFARVAGRVSPGLSHLLMTADRSLYEAKRGRPRGERPMPFRRRARALWELMRSGPVSA